MMAKSNAPRLKTECDQQLPHREQVAKWSVDDVLAWLRTANLVECSSAFSKRRIDGASLMSLTEENLLHWSGDIKIRQRMQITKYLNECRNRESDNQGRKPAPKFKVKKSEPPPVPKIDYAASVADDESYQDGGWDTDFDDDLEEEDEASTNGEKESAKNQASAKIKVSDSHEESPSPSRENNRISNIIMKLKMDSPSVIRNQEKPKVISRSISDIIQGNSDVSNKSEATAEAPAKKKIPRPPNSLIPLPRIPPRPQCTPPKPPQQPPLPPPVILQMILKSAQLKKADDSVSNQNGAAHDDDPDDSGDTYETPLVDNCSKASSVDLHADSGSGSGSIDRSTNSSPLHYPLTGSGHLQGSNGSFNQSQLEFEPECEQDETYSAVDESQWSGSSSGVSVTSNHSDGPALPPKPRSPNFATPPPLPEKPPQRERQVTSPTAADPQLPTNRRLPRKISDESLGKTGTLNGCKQAIKKLTNFANKITSDRRAESMIAVDKVTTPERETFPTLGEASNLKKSTSASSLRNGYGDSGLSLVGNRPLPPVPNRLTPGTTNNNDDRLSRLQPSPSQQATQTAHPLDSHPWFQRVERDHAEFILKRMEMSGSYLVRESRRGGQFNPYTLTLYFDDKPFHLNIRSRPDGKFALGKEKPNEKTFSTVVELITFHQRDVILLTAKGMQIGQTCLKHCPPKQ